MVDSAFSLGFHGRDLPPAMLERRKRLADRPSQQDPVDAEPLTGEAAEFEAETLAGLQLSEW